MRHLAALSRIATPPVRLHLCKRHLLSKILSRLNRLVLAASSQALMGHSRTCHSLRTQMMTAKDVRSTRGTLRLPSQRPDNLPLNGWLLCSRSNEENPRVQWMSHLSWAVLSTDKASHSPARQTNWMACRIGAGLASQIGTFLIATQSGQIPWTLTPPHRGREASQRETCCPLVLGQ